jgi:hypothetical protein
MNKPAIEEIVNEATAKYLAIFHNHIGNANRKRFYPADLVAFGLLNRNLGLLEAMPALFEKKNIHSLAPLLRVQLDGLLRLHAFRIVDSIDDLAQRLIQGEQLRQYLDRDGERLKDRYLVASLKRELPWVEDMYTTLSGWVHFSETHVFSALAKGAEERTIEIGIGSFQKELPEQLFEDAKGAVQAIHSYTAFLLEAYFHSRENV